MTPGKGEYGRKVLAAVMLVKVWEHGGSAVARPSGKSRTWGSSMAAPRLPSQMDGFFIYALIFLHNTID